MARNIDIAWAAGLFEGEGSCFMGSSGQRQPVVCLAMTDEDVVRRFAAVMGVGNVRTYQRPPNKPVWQWSAQSRDDVLAVLGLLWPHLGLRRRARATEVLERAAAIQPRNGPRSHCRRGHPLEGDNLYVHQRTGKRHCAVCRRAANKRQQIDRRTSRLAA